MRPLLLVLVAFVLSVTAAAAFEPPNVRHWPGTVPASSPTVVKVGQTGVYTWQAVDQYGWSGWRDVVGRSLDSGSSYTDSLGNALNRFLASENRGQIVIREAQAGETPDIRHFAVPTPFLESKCGAWATACVYLLNPLPVPVWYKAASMITWSFVSEAAVVEHETFHALARACDQYQGGCPRASDGVWLGTVACLGNPDTLMDCGGAARTVTLFDYVTFVTAFEPSAPFLQVRSCTGPTDQFGNVWDDCLQRWIGVNGWRYDPTSGTWELPNGTPEWTACNADNLRWNLYLASITQDRVGWFPVGHAFFSVERGFWSGAPEC